MASRTGTGATGLPSLHADATTATPTTITQFRIISLLFRDLGHGSQILPQNVRMVQLGAWRGVLREDLRRVDADRATDADHADLLPAPNALIDRDDMHAGIRGILFHGPQRARYGQR